MMNIPLLIGGLGGWEVFLILLVVLLLFGAKRLPELARGLGKGIREFKGAVEGIEKELDDTVDSIEKTTEKPESPGE
ncbi:MAG: twin-arginine translocase TatA/TatE family subunit [Candidatus Marinimicrobia bacterium]|jgi:sec-independent protein translocase protein TatA|nr:twin-arginine translocase TatA/TatE family subunit [Candidatus Neomarinimicrobiota bacterium]MDP6836155.1 twin-arginine translocase TatA/TatE family subunit [Candidatus Neomarinimicrobiota bacterium]MDP6967164.1 twin-arginine translocase TatA/TatE family subunit [Candidatus Neomarinimicrobiota bacterium]|tara:strand:- start:4465 stop:4695 length:231 start_codon:yes stop_codon:yes gene_type:complete